MSKRRLLISFMLMCIATAFSSVSIAATLSISNVSINNIAMNKRLIRLNDNGMILENAGMSLEATVRIAANGLKGQRVVALVYPVDDNGYTFTDNNGDVVSAGAVTIPTATYKGAVTVQLPYHWVSTLDGKPICSKIYVALVCVDNDASDEKEVELNPSTVHIDNSNMEQNLLGDLLGGGGNSGMGDMLGGLFGSMFGSGSVEATQVCPACDGTGLCGQCDGEGFLHPHLCRKCASDPGICRRCKGTGTITTTFDVY